MWQKILWRIVRIGISTIPWTEIANEVLDWVREKLKEADGITGDDLINRLEEILARVTGLDVDINNDGI